MSSLSPDQNLKFLFSWQQMVEVFQSCLYQDIVFVPETHSIVLPSPPLWDLALITVFPPSGLEFSALCFCGDHLLGSELGKVS